MFFDEIIKDKENIEREFGDNLTWERMDDKKASRIKYEISISDGFNQENWEEMIDFMVETSIKFETVFKDRLNKTSNELK